MDGAAAHEECSTLPDASKAAADEGSETTMRPADEGEVVEAVRWAVAQRAPLEIVGSGSKLGLGRPVQARATLDVSQLTGVTLYEPEELVLRAAAGTPMAEIEALLAENGQEIASEPMDYGPLHRRKRGGGTVGGMIACNLAGPRRLKAGAARDQILGVRVVTGRAEAIKSGGRVVKNVTGYDLSKGMTGAYGTLGVLSEVTIKVLPRAETEVTLALRGLDDAAATAAMARAMGSSHEVSGAAHLPALVAARVVDGALGSDPATLLRVEGFPVSVAARVDALEGLLGGHIQRVERDASRALWRDVRDVAPFADGTERAVWRVSAAPGDGYKIVEAMRQGTGVDAFYDWQGGLAWLRMEDDAEADALRRATTHFGGHATLVRAPAAVRASVPVFEPEPGPLAALSGRLKAQFDPEGVLNPGRMVAGR